MFSFCVARVVGNQLPPKDAIGTKIRSLKYVLEQDRQIPCDKIWLLNRIIDEDYLQEVKTVLEGQTIYEVPFEGKEYRNLVDRQAKLRYLTNINPARNKIIRQSQTNYEFTISLDQDCFFFPENWDFAVKSIIDDCGSRKYYGLVSKRLVDVTKIWDEPDNEPMLIFRHDADLLFDENLVFGQNDKRELLFRLGYSPDWKATKLICQTAGYIMHIGYDERIERNGPYRNSERRTGLNYLIERADKKCRMKMI
jgi:hypothetical protein